MFFGGLKNANIASGCENNFLQFVRVSNKGFEKKCAFFVFVFLCWKKYKGQYENIGKGNFQKKTRKIVFLDGCEERVFFCKNVIF